MLSYANGSNLPRHEYSVPKQNSEFLLMDKQSQLMPDLRDDHINSKANTILSLHPHADAHMIEEFRLSAHSKGRDSDILPGSFSSN